MKNSNFFLVSITLCLYACAAPVKLLDYHGADSATLAKIWDLQVVGDAALTENRYTDLGIVNGLSCNNAAWDTSSSAATAEQSAKDQVSLRAAELGADYITAPQCTLDSERELPRGCSAILLCTSHALAKTSP